MSPSPNLAELKDVAKRFSQGGVSHYLTLTLDEAEALLYVGAREAVFALATGTVELKAAVRSQGTPRGGNILGGAVVSSPLTLKSFPRSPGKPPWTRKPSASRRARITRWGARVPWPQWGG